MKRAMFLLIVFVLLAPGFADDGPPITIFEFALLIDGTGEPLSGHEIAIRDGEILAVGDDLNRQYSDALSVDLKGLVALPGLIDVHVHMTYGLNAVSQGKAWEELFASSASERLVAAKRNAILTLESGVTTVRDLFSLDGVGVQIKEMIDSGKTPGPRMFLSGAAIHPLTLPNDWNTTDLSDKEKILRNETALRVEQGVDWLKIFATTGTADDLTGVRLFGYTEIKAVTDIAHAAGLGVAVHSYSSIAVADALRAGVDSIEHAVGVNDDTLNAWAATDTIYVPTIDHNRYYADHRGEYGYSRKTADELGVFVQQNIDMLARARKAGIEIAMGSDAVLTGFGQNTRELEWFVVAGMTPSESIRSATMIGAKLLGQENSLGRLQPGYAADIIAVQGNPLENIKALTGGVKWVMKDGETVVNVAGE